MLFNVSCSLCRPSLAPLVSLKASSKIEHATQRLRRSFKPRQNARRVAVVVDENSPFLAPSFGICLRQLKLSKLTPLGHASAVNRSYRLARRKREYRGLHCYAAEYCVVE